MVVTACLEKTVFLFLMILERVLNIKNPEGFLFMFDGFGAGNYFSLFSLANKNQALRSLIFVLNSWFFVTLAEYHLRKAYNHLYGCCCLLYRHS